MRRLLLLTVALAACVACIACATGPPAPAELQVGADACRHCRMVVSDSRLAAQLVAPGEEPLFFDDIGCLRDYLAGRPAIAGGGNGGDQAMAYVADHRTRAWVPAVRAVYTRLESLQTPMGSHLIAHADAASRDADAAVRGETPLTASQVFPAGGPPGGGR